MQNNRLTYFLVALALIALAYLVVILNNIKQIEYRTTVGSTDISNLQVTDNPQKTVDASYLQGR